MERKFSITTFKPAIIFILKFLGMYIVGNLLYGFFITHFEPRPDPATIWVTEQVATILNWLEGSITTQIQISKPTVLVIQKNPILSVFEGCNGINVMIIFAAFILSFGPYIKKLWWFVPTGIVVIHMANLLRIGLLFFISKYYPDHLYYLHKYFFTAFIYAVVFALWYYWIHLSNGNQEDVQTD